MELWKSVDTCGENIDFGFSVGYDLDYDRFAKSGADETDGADARFEDINYADIENDAVLDWDYIRSIDIDDALEESFWEMLNGEEPDRQIVSLLEALPEYPILRYMDDEKLEDFVYEFVSETIVTTEVSYFIDGIDVTVNVGTFVGDWDEFVFSSITDAVVCKLRGV